MDKQQIAKDILNKYKLQGYVPKEKQSVDLSSRFDEIDAIASGQTQEKQKRDGLLKSIVKDAAGTLVVNPITRATSAVTQLVAPESAAAKGFQEFQDTGSDQKVLGVDVPAVKGFGEGGGKQIVGEALKTASYLFPYGKAAGAVTSATGSKILGNVVAGASGGYAADAGYGLTDENQSVGEALTPGLGTAIGAAIPMVGPALRVTGRATKKAGEKLVDAVIPASTREAGILQTYKANNPFFKRVADVLKGTEKAPITAGKTVATEGLMGTKSQIGVQAKRAEQKLWNDVISPRLKASNQAVDMDGFFAKIQDDIVKSTPEASRQKSLLNALESFKDDYAGINSVSLEKLQKIKEGWAEFIPEKAYRGENISGAANQVRKLMANESRQTIYSQLGDDVKQAYFDYGNLQGLKKMGVVSMTGQKLKGGTGGLVSEIFSQAVTPVGTVGGQAIYKIGKGIEFVGNLGAKNLGEALGVNLKFPGDAAVDDISASLKKVNKIPNKQGGFIKVGQEAKAPMTTQTATKTAKTSNTVIPKTIPQEQSLINEAKKYKSAEEFVSSQVNFNHASAGEIKSFTKDFPNQKPVFLTKDANYYKEHISPDAKNTPVKVDLGKTITLDDATLNKILKGSDNTPKMFQDANTSARREVFNWLKMKGYDSATLPKDWNRGTQYLESTVVFDPAKQIRTKSELISIWNKLNK